MKTRGKRCGLCRELGHRMETCDLERRESAGQQTRRDRDLVREMLTPCPLCRVVGPTARLGEHLAVDHGRREAPIVVWAETG